MKETSYTEKFDKNILNFFRSAIFRTHVHPAMTRFLMHAWTDQRHAVKQRDYWLQQGIHVPPLMIVSITNRCNLNCLGCYARAIHPESEAEMDDSRLSSLVEEAKNLGVSIIMIAGGEPLLRPVFFELAERHPHILFLVFTNGLLLDDEKINRCKKMRNLVPMISLEGPQMETDLRRGSGIFKMVEDRMEKLHKAGIFFGTSLTLTGRNFPTITTVEFQKHLNQLGSQLSIFVDYVPVKPGTEALVLTPEQKGSEKKWMSALNEHVPGLFLSLPGDEEYYGGCLAGGRGFIHVNPQGQLEACPFAPFSDTTVSSMTLKEALGSDLMRVIRENADRLSESRGGCTLWENREWVMEQIENPEK